MASSGGSAAARRERLLQPHVALRTLALPPTPRAVTYLKTFRNGGSKRLPVLPSDHYGLLVELEPI